VLKTNISCWMILADKRFQSPSWIKRGICWSVFLVFICNGCKDSQPEKFDFQQIGTTMGTTFSVKIPVLPDKVDRKDLKEGIAQILDGINRKMSTYLSDSELSRFNQNQSVDWISVSPEMLEVVVEAQQISHLSNGAYDITIGPLVNLWGFGPSDTGQKVPDALSIDELLQQTGSKFLEFRREPHALRKKMASLYLDLSSLAKGYAVDRVAAYLESLGIKDFLVEIGGELKANGRKQDGQFWRVAVEKPDPAQRSIGQVLELNNIAVATSGDYRNFFDQDGQRYSHTIDPRTGKPITHRLASVTVLSNTTMRADGLATAFMVLGHEAGMRMAERERIPVLFIIQTDQGFSKIQSSQFPSDTK